MSERAAPAPLFAVRALRAGFDGAAVLDIGTLDVAAGGITVLVGENGSGKTTLLRVLNALHAPREGRVSFLGRDFDEGGRADVRARSVLVHQAPLLFRGTVRANVAWGLRVRGTPRAEAAVRAEATLARVGLEGFGPRRASALSGGEKQRVGLARALALSLPVLLVDEPTANLDPGARAVVEAVLREEAARGTSVILSTHAMDVAWRLGDALVRLECGRVVETAENVLRGRVEGRDERFTRFAVDGSGGAAGRQGAAGPVLLCPAQEGDFRVAVLPMDELILSRHPLESSARNQLRGRVTAVEPAGALLRVTVDCGAPLRALVTPAAAAELGLGPGAPVVVVFKASAVRLY